MKHQTRYSILRLRQYQNIPFIEYKKLERLKVYVKELQTWTFQMMHLFYELNSKINSSLENRKCQLSIKKIRKWQNSTTKAWLRSRLDVKLKIRINLSYFMLLSFKSSLFSFSICNSFLIFWLVIMEGRHWTNLKIVFVVYLASRNLNYEFCNRLLEFKIVDFYKKYCIVFAMRSKLDIIREILELWSHDID